LDCVRLDPVSPDAAKKALSLGMSGSPSVYDKVMGVVNQVRSNYALAEREAIGTQAAHYRPLRSGKTRN